MTFLVADNSAITVFGWFVDLATSGLIVNFVCFFWVYIGWYRALKAQNFDRKSLPYYCNFAPYTAWFGLIFGCLIILFLGFDSFSPFSIQSFITTYFGIAWAAFMFTLWKVLKKTKFADPAAVDIYHGKAEVDAECAIWEHGGLEENEKNRLAEMNVMRRTWEKIW
jgi:amino acid transporter